MKLILEVSSELVRKMKTVAITAGSPLEKFAVEMLDTATQQHLDDAAELITSSRIFDTLEEAKSSAAKADKLDAREHDWYYYQKEGRFMPECSRDFHRQYTEDGWEVVEV